MRRIDMLMQTMDEINAPIAVTDNITGHASRTMHNLYSRPSVAVKRKWLLKLQKAMK